MKKTMTKSDLNLISQAENMTDWMEIDELEEQAQSAEAKSKLHDLAVRMYHYEEFDCYGEI